MKLLVVGANGFIGSNTILYFNSKGWNTVGLDRHSHSMANRHERCDLLTDDVTGILRKHTPDAIINASGTGTIQLSLVDPVRDRALNVLSTERLLSAIIKSNIQTKYIHVSSAAVYGNPKRLPVQESDASRNSPISPYGNHKFEAEEAVARAHSFSGLPTASVRIFSCYGQGQQKLLLWDIFQKIKASSTGTITLFGTGNETRDFIHIGDVARAIEVLLSKGDFNGSAINLASGSETTIRAMAEQFCFALGANVRVQFNRHTRPGDPAHWRADMQKFQDLGFRAEISIPQGLELYARYVRSL